MLQDLRFAVRLVLKDRWYSVVAVIALALGIGLNATVFTLVNAVLIRGLPFQNTNPMAVAPSRTAWSASPTRVIPQTLKIGADVTRALRSDR